MDAQAPDIYDHCKIQIYVRSLGRSNPTAFTAIVERLQRIETLEVSDNPRRVIQPKFITVVDKNLHKFGELQVHRKIFGFLGIAIVPTENGEPDGMAALGASRAHFDSLKKEYNDVVLSSKCLTFGMPALSRTFFDSEDLLTFDSYNGKLDDFEDQIHDYLRPIYFILESRRLDTAFESSDQPTCPMLPEEEVYTVRTKDKKTHKKSIGRLRKQKADYAMLSGFPSIAQDLYHSASEQLKSSGDLLWLAAAYEGWAISSLLLREQGFAINENYKKIVSKLNSALENYERYSFAAFVEFECVLKTANVFKQQRMFIETESFLREHVGKYLDDDFTLFDNYIKAQICMITAEIYKSIGFVRKCAFYARLAVLFRLHVNENERKTETDYRLVYPILYGTLPGYGINVENGLTHKQPSSKGHVGIQVKTLHEVFMSAKLAGYIEAAIRHLCYILQVYFFHIDDANKLQLIDDLKRLIRVHLEKHGKLSLVHPLSIENSPVVLPPIQMTRFPLITNFRIQPLPANLEPSILPPDDQAIDNVFIYSPFQDRGRAKKVLWIVDTVCHVKVQVQNLLPAELVVHSLVLHTEGCDFESVPVRLNLSAATSSDSPSHQRVGLSAIVSSNPVSQPNNNSLSTMHENNVEGSDKLDRTPISSSSTEISLLGVPRSPGLLKVTGYSCVVFDMENRCYVQHSGTSGQSKQDLQVEVLPALPKLQVTTSLKRAPVVEEEALVGEATIFSGQTFTHSIWLQNTDKKTSIRSLRCRIVEQPTGFGGPPLVELLMPDKDDSNKEEEYQKEIPKSSLRNKEARKETNELRFGQIGPMKKRKILVRLFGIDPASTTTAQETQVLIRKHQRSHTTMVELADDKSLLLRMDDEDDAEAQEDQQLLERKDSVLSAPARIEKDGRDSTRRTHDLIPYTGRLLTATVEFTYIADIPTLDRESYERNERLSLAITIVPALTVIDWQVIAGDSSTTRFVVVDVTNLCDFEAELTFGADQRMISVQPRELCRVPLLCPCSTRIHAADFQQAVQKASHMMQKHEIEQLRKRMEKHISTHLEIKWKISMLELEGLVPVGPLLASVSFLKQLVVPSISISVSINGRPYIGEGDIVAGIGEMQRMEIQITCVASSSDNTLNSSGDLNKLPTGFKGELALRCFQDLQNGKELIDRTESLVACGVQRRPFNLKPKEKKVSEESNVSLFTTQYTFFFRTEGIYKLKPDVVRAYRGQTPIQQDELFVPSVSFKVVTRIGSSFPSVSSFNRQSNVV